MLLDAKISVWDFIADTKATWALPLALGEFICIRELKSICLTFKKTNCDMIPRYQVSGVPHLDSPDPQEVCNEALKMGLSDGSRPIVCR